MIEIIIVAATRFYREGLALALQNADGFEVIATLARPEELEPDLAARTHGVVLLDISDLSDGPSVVLALRARNPGLRLIALGVSAQEYDIIAYAELGAAGYLTRDHSISELVRTIESVAHGELRCSPRVAAALSRRVAELSAEVQPGPNAGLLSRREAEVAVLLEQGLSNQEISRQLCIALATVKNHVHNILDKLGLQGRAAAAAWARQQRLDHSVLIRSTLHQALPPSNRPHS
ncbi:LuxR C-terminal-related transcriptional regulator [Saccharopolyspora phatthalungensis]|uniref:DNA-binding NarL/FixJ family response regulator n=1 Tax=Saccharopolyspora phatthalungensis TaxID=664693 RepID=A0A840QK91_9PSEU|nr:response regulator transcription factor [Saccharopolyspora phatthalungensis]MBB5158683.1 DNA-binding NarL/FixJ family response regulator [Saccharopolyspora phatthalungensis]